MLQGLPLCELTTPLLPHCHPLPPLLTSTSSVAAGAAYGYALCKLFNALLLIGWIMWQGTPGDGGLAKLGRALWASLAWSGPWAVLGCQPIVGQLDTHTHPCLLVSCWLAAEEAADLEAAAAAAAAASSVSVDGAPESGSGSGSDAGFERPGQAVAGTVTAMAATAVVTGAALAVEKGPARTSLDKWSYDPDIDEAPARDQVGPPTSQIVFNLHVRLPSTHGPSCRGLSCATGPAGYDEWHVSHLRL